MKLKLELDLETAERLAEAATRERRSMPLEAEILLKRALGLSEPRWQPASEDALAGEVRDAART